MGKGISGGRNRNFDIERTHAFQSILDIIDQQRKIAGPAPLIVAVTDTDPEKIKKTAAAQAWEMIEHGVRHLMDGGPAGTPGLFHVALSKMSLRASPLAQALGIGKMPFEDENVVALYHDGFTAAYAPTKRLMEAAIHDARDAKRVIAQAIERAEAPKTGFFLTPEERVGLISPERIKQMVEQLKKPARPADVFNALDEANKGPAEERELLKKHQRLMLDHACDAYQTACHIVHDRLHAFLTPRAAPPRTPPTL